LKITTTLQDSRLKNGLPIKNSAAECIIFVQGLHFGPPDKKLPAGHLLRPPADLAFLMAVVLTKAGRFLG
jgi:hypothetical protein